MPNRIMEIKLLIHWKCLAQCVSKNKRSIIIALCYYVFNHYNSHSRWLLVPFYRWENWTLLELDFRNKWAKFWSQMCLTSQMLSDSPSDLRQGRDGDRWPSRGNGQSLELITDYQVYQLVPLCEWIFPLFHKVVFS